MTGKAMRVENGFIWNYLKEYKMLYIDAADTLRLIVGYKVVWFV